MTRRRPWNRLWAFVALAALASLLPDALTESVDPVAYYGYYDAATLDAEPVARHGCVVGDHLGATRVVGPGPARFYLPTAPAPRAPFAPCRRGIPRAPPA